MDDLRESLLWPLGVARPAESLLINAGMKYGGHFLKKFPAAPAVQNATTRAMHSHRVPNVQDDR
jgi:hypothetical protein